MNPLRSACSPFRSSKARLMAVILAAAGIVSLVGLGARYAAKVKERRLVAVLRQNGVFVFYDYECDDAGSPLAGGRPPAGPAWIRRIVGDDFFARPATVTSFPETRAEVLRILGQLTTVTRVDLTGLASTSEPFKAISTLPNLTSLELNDAEIDLHDLARISPMRGVKMLQLRGTRVTDAACALFVQKFPALAELDLQGTGDEDDMQPSADGLSSIRQLPNLARLSVLDSSGVTVDAVAGLSGSPKLRELCADVRVDVEGTRLRIHDCPRLELLEVGRAPWGVPLRWKLFLEDTPRIKNVSVEYVDELNLGATHSLERLSLTECNIAAVDLSQLVACAALVEVELRDYRGDTGAALRELEKIPSIKVLALPGTTLADDDLKRIGSFRQLEALDISNNFETDDRDLSRLEALKNLRRLKLWGTKVTAAGVGHIEKAIPGLHCILVLVNP